MQEEIPVVVEFVPGSRISRGKPVERSLPIMQNGPPGTVVHFEHGGQVPLPTDQIVFRDEATGSARVGFGGMRFCGIVDSLLTFRRVQDLLPAEFLSPERGWVMTLEPSTVSGVFVHGVRAWPTDQAV